MFRRGDIVYGKKDKTIFESFSLDNTGSVDCLAAKHDKIGKCRNTWQHSNFANYGDNGFTRQHHAL